MSFNQKRLLTSVFSTISSPLVCVLASAGMLSVLSACGSGTGTTSTAASTDVTAQVSSATMTFGVSAPTTEIPLVTVSPTFHVAPVILVAPSDVDVVNPVASARLVPSQQAIPSEFQGLSTRGLTLSTLQSVHSARLLSAQSVNTGAVTPKVSSSFATTYTPAQIRAAYGLPSLPASFTGLSAAQAAQLGAGQTIYIVDAQSDPNVVAELTAFNQKFGLPACTVKTIATNASLPLSAPSVSSCDFSIVYSTPAAGMTSTAPAYNSGWATEITLDVQWAHATAPLARIVLIESADASNTGLIGAINLANKMGPGVVSMSFGGVEGSWTASVDSAFSNAQMTYLAATGDNGAGVSWPSVSSRVLAIGGTSLTYSGGTRSEAIWSGTGGGVSAYTPTPAYQNNAVPGMGTPTNRTVADVSFNADPSTGQYVAVINQGSSSVGWLSAGGTSLATPQWAGIIAVANALRVQSSKALLGAPHTVLYQQISTVPGAYASSFADIKQGNDGSCAACSAKTGYDFPAGLGTPNVTNLLTALAGSGAVSAPVVNGASVSGQVGTPLSFTVSASSPNPLSFSLSGAPSGLSINSTGIVTWAMPVAGTYTVTITATDAKANLSGKGVYVVTIAAPVPPVVTGANVSGKVGTALSFTASINDSNPYTVSLSGAPSGMTINSAGVVSWATPVLGTYSVTVTATDSKTGLSGKGVYVVTIAMQPAPVVSGGSISGTVGTSLSFAVSVANSNPLTYTLSGAPSGLTISTGGIVTWAKPVVGTYNVTVIVKDTKTGLSGQGIYTIVISAVAPVGPVITAPAMTGVAGKAMSGTISVTDTGATGISISISGVPLGMTLMPGSATGISLVASWSNPVTGTYTLKVTVTDNLGRTATVSVPVTITAH